MRTTPYRLGLLYKVCVERLPGKPDIVFTKQKLALQVRGCFWHQQRGVLIAGGRRPMRRTGIPSLIGTVSAILPTITCFPRLAGA